MASNDQTIEMNNQLAVSDAISGLQAGDFSRLEPVFVGDSGGPLDCKIMDWYTNGAFDGEPKALAEALTCACFLGYREVAEFLMDEGVDPTAGDGTGLNAFHWAANRGQLEVVMLLIERRVPLERRSMYEGTVLGTAVWAAIHETKPRHLEIIEALIAAGAELVEAGYPTGDERVDALLRRYHETRS